MVRIWIVFVAVRVCGDWSSTALKDLEYFLAGTDVEFFTFAVFAGHGRFKDLEYSNYCW